MENSERVPTDILEVLERVLMAAVKELRRARELQSGPVPELAERSSRYRRKSVLRCCEDILREAPGPMHTRDLLAKLEEMGAKTSRETLVSGLTRRRYPDGPFVRTAPNTFGLASRDQEGI